jgi:hypothetical protein
LFLNSISLLQKVTLLSVVRNCSSFPSWVLSVITILYFHTSQHMHEVLYLDPYLALFISSYSASTRNTLNSLWGRWKGCVTSDPVTVAVYWMVLGALLVPGK